MYHMPFGLRDRGEEVLYILRIAHTQLYESRAGILNAPHPWPRSEAEMLTLQREEEPLRRDIDSLIYSHQFEINTKYGAMTPATSDQSQRPHARSHREFIASCPDPSDVHITLQMTPLVNISNRHYCLSLGPNWDYGALRVLYQQPCNECIVCPLGEK